MISTVRTMTLEELAEQYGIEIVSTHVVQRGYPVLTFPDLINIKVREPQPADKGGWTAPKVSKAEVVGLQVDSVQAVPGGVGLSAHADITVLPQEAS